MIELARILRVVVSAFEESQLGYVVVGSVAAAAWGVARTTRDIDVVVVVDVERIEAVLDALAGAGLYVPTERAREAAGTSGSFNVLDPEHGGKVDIFVVHADDEFTASRLRRSVRADVFGIPCSVASAEDVILAKLRWRSTSRSEVQWRDCIEMVATNDVDRGYLRAWARRLDVADDLEALLRSTT